MTRIGIFSGTFDPVHTGHVAFALQASKECKLDTVYFLPEKKPREKQGVTSYSNRAAMLKIAIKNNSNLQLGPELGDRFTVRYTLPKIQKEFDGARVVFLLGSDVVRTFTYRWEGLQEFLESVELCIGLRKSDDPQDIITILEAMKKQYNAKLVYCLIGSDKEHVSSTTIRRKNHSISDLDSDVAAYIADKNLYSDE